MAASLKVIDTGMATATTDRQKALDAALAQIDRAFGKGSAMRLGSKETMQVEVISTGSLGLDIALGVGETFVWALPQVMRDGFVHFETEEGDGAVDAHDDVLFPLALGREAEVIPGFSTAILTSAGGAEQRNAAWAEARTSYDVGPGLRSEADIGVLLAFFRARMGAARGFRLRDPFDFAAAGEVVGVGDGVARRFALVKSYGAAERRITRPVAGSVVVAVDGIATSAFSVEAGGWVVLDVAPAAGAVVTAGFTFDVPVRFAEDRLSVARATFLAGMAASVPLIEVREG